MADDPNNSPPILPTSSPSASRLTKTARSSTAGTVRPRPSPGPGPSNEQSGDGRPPTKRARKAINCEPCRNSKLKCDRNRPCSSCVLRGTAAMCYQDSRGHEGSDSAVRGDDHHYSRVDPAQEIARLRHSISLLESYIFPNQRNNVANLHQKSSITLKKELVEPDVSEKGSSAPGMLTTQVQGGMYAGPTGAAVHLLINDNRVSEESESRQQSQDRTEESPMSSEYDRDLLTMLPPVDIIDGLIAYYFDYCNWIYRHVNRPSFMHLWERYKNGSSADRITLATACVIMAVATHYLEPGSTFLEGQLEPVKERSSKFYEIALMALSRWQEESKTYTMELIELLLIRTHYLNMSKTDSEDVWSLRGELASIAIAMGLHRDPGKWRMHRDIAERRRWAWWHIILLERWQAFMFGRPLVIASHHFDTQLPSYCDPALDKTGRLYLPNFALFRLAFILGDIMDDAVSVRPVPYESIQANDRALTRWFEDMPHELDMDEYRVARSLASSDQAQRRFAVQSMIIRTSYYHIRFSLHRPYASANSTQTQSQSGRKGPTLDPAKTAKSLEIAVSAADKLVSMTRGDFLTNSSMAAPGHMNWGPFHCFSAAMFFAFQLVANPDQPGANLFRANIRKAMTTIEQSRGAAVSDRAYDILNALSPLCSNEFVALPPEMREKQQAQILSVVRKLAFPYYDSRDQRRYGESPLSRHNASSPSNSHSLSPPLNGMILNQFEPMPTPTQLSRVTPGIIPHPQQSLTSPGYSAHTQTNTSNTYVDSSNQHHQSSHHSQHTQHTSHQHQQVQQQPPMLYTEPHARYAQYIHHPVDGTTMWGAAVGFGHSEWNQFLDVIGPEVQGPNIRHLAPS